MEEWKCENIEEILVFFICIWLGVVKKLRDEKQIYLVEKKNEKIKKIKKKKKKREEEEEERERERWEKENTYLKQFEVRIE